MSLNYTLHQSSLPRAEGAYYASVVKSRNYRIEEVIDQITQSSTAKADLLAAWEKLRGAMIDIAERGDGLVDDLLAFEPAIRGKFDGPSDQFTSSRHQAVIKMRPGPQLKQAIERASKHKVAPRRLSPEVYEVLEFGTHARNPVLRSGGALVIRGWRMKLHEDVPDEGVFLLRSGRPAVRIPHPRSTASEILCVLPELDQEPGPVLLEVRARHRNGKELRTGQYPEALRVE